MLIQSQNKPRIRVRRHAHRNAISQHDIVTSKHRGSVHIPYLPTTWSYSSGLLLSVPRVGLPRDEISRRDLEIAFISSLLAETRFDSGISRDLGEIAWSIKMRIRQAPAIFILSAAILLPCIICPLDHLLPIQQRLSLFTKHSSLTLIIMPPKKRARATSTRPIPNDLFVPQGVNSHVWQHFKVSISEPDWTFCCVSQCTVRRVAKSGSTTQNMRAHLNKKLMQRQRCMGPPPLPASRTSL